MYNSIYIKFEMKSLHIIVISITNQEISAMSRHIIDSNLKYSIYTTKDLLEILTDEQF